MMYVWVSSWYISLNVVVCMPLWWDEDMLPVRAFAPGRRVFMMVLLPTPELPERSDILPERSERRGEMPWPWSADSRSVV